MTAKVRGPMLWVVSREWHSEHTVLAVCVTISAARRVAEADLRAVHEDKGLQACWNSRKFDAPVDPQSPGQELHASDWAGDRQGRWFIDRVPVE